MDTHKARKAILEELDRQVKSMSKQDYLDVLEMLEDDLEYRIEAVTDELTEEEEE